jgi:hypothetical protein
MRKTPTTQSSSAQHPNIPPPTSSAMQERTDGMTSTMLKPEAEPSDKKSTHPFVQSSVHM